MFSMPLRKGFSMKIKEEPVEINFTMDNDNEY